MRVSTLGIFFLTPLLFRKLDAESRRAWEVFQTAEARWRQLKVEANLAPALLAPGVGRNKYDVEFADMLQFLHERGQAFDRAGKGFDRRTGPVSTKTSGGAAAFPEQDESDANIEDIYSLAAGATTDNRRSPSQQNSGARPTSCPLCHGKDHTYLSKCPQFLKLDSRTGTQR